MPIGPNDPTHFKHVDRVHVLPVPTLQDYIQAVSDYIANRDQPAHGIA